MRSNLLGKGGQCYIIPTQAISGVTPITSAIITTDVIDLLSLQLVTTGTVAGTWTIQASNDYIATPAGEAYGSQPTQATGTFSSYTGFTFAAPAGSPTSQFVEKSGFGPRAFKLTFTPSSGAGNVTAIMFGKGNR